ncbi:MAG TPA: chromosome partitioning protein ParB [Actinomycetota bacterium]|nr:chromosome partitioning protein ParB [Actinomycetota bacterium]
MRKDTGLPAADAADDFQRARRRQVLARLRGWLRREPDDINVMLPYDEVVSALGYEGEKYVGLETIPLDSIVGSVDRREEFDKQFRPTSNRPGPRWQRIDEAQRRGEPMPPIDVYRVGDLHFVKDGHHRVSVAAELGYDVIDANVTEIRTRLPADGISLRGDIITKSYERIFRARVPLPPDLAEKIDVSDPWSYAELAENVEAWGFRLIQDEERFIARQAVALRWFKEEYEPVVKMLKEADLIGAGTQAEAYMRFARERYRLLRTHEWNEEIIQRLREGT